MRRHDAARAWLCELVCVDIWTPRALGRLSLRHSRAFAPLDVPLRRGRKSRIRSQEGSHTLCTLSSSQQSDSFKFVSVTEHLLTKD